MMARKKRITILAVSIVLVILAITATMVYLYLKTDLFKTKETLFAKYLLQNFDKIDILKSNESLLTEGTINKYTTDIEGKIEYVEDKGTSSENKNSNVNNVKLKITGNLDNDNDYKYYDIAITNQNEKLLGLEYLEQEEKQGIRLNGIKQFVSTNVENVQEDSQENKIKSIQELISEGEIESLLNFTEEEKQTLANTYMGIIQKNVTKDQYHKQSKTLITINNKDMQTNAYYISLTLEEFNNLYIKLLEQLSGDEIILSKIDKVQDKIKKINSNYSENLREKFVANIKTKIEDIQNNNIGNQKVRIIVYENNGKTVRTSIEKETEKITIDFYNGSSMKITNTEIGDITKEESIKIEKQSNENQSSTAFEYEKTEDNEIKINIHLDYEKATQGDEIQKQFEFGIANESNEVTLKITNTINIVDEFENQITLDTDNIDMDKLNEEQKNIIKQALSTNIQNQITNLEANISVNDYTKVLQNIGILKKNSIQLPNEGDITETERKRFNSQFEFFVSENLTSNNIKELLNTTEGNFENMKVLLKSGEVQDLDLEKLNSTKDSTEYKKSIDEILFFIKRNSNNEEKVKETEEYLEKNNNNKYTVSIQYDNDGLTRIIRAKIQ